MKKATDEQIINAYNKTGNVWKVAKLLGMCGQSVHSRVVRLGIVHKMNKISNEDLLKIKSVYESGIERGDGKLKKLSAELGRTIPFISRKAKAMGLTTYSHKMAKEAVANLIIKAKSRIAIKGHPKGFLGHRHTAESKAKMSANLRKSFKNKSIEEKAEMTLKSMKTKVQKYGANRWFNPRNKSSWKAAWRKVGSKKIFFRSRWEYNYAVYLQYLKKNKQIKKWEHEPQVFWFEKIKRGVRSYLPDFRVTLNDGSIEYHEVKGWYDKASQLKTKRMAKYYPDIKLKMIFSKDYLALEKEFGEVLPGWEKKA